MWILIYILFSAPMEVKKMQILETHFLEIDCVQRLKEAIKIGLPPNSNMGCIFLGEVSKT